MTSLHKATGTHIEKSLVKTGSWRERKKIHPRLISAITKIKKVQAKIIGKVDLAISTHFSKIY